MPAPLQLQLRGLSRFYTEGERIRVMLRGVDITVRAGECVALFGRSGSG